MIDENLLETVRDNVLSTIFEVAVHENILTAYDIRPTTQHHS
jgi:hypothetical protein